MRTIDLEEYLAQVRRRKHALETAGVRLPSDAELRNNGTRRAAGKRALLQRCDERARASGVEPVKHNY